VGPGLRAQSRLWRESFLQSHLILIFNMTIIKKRGRIKMKNNLNLVIVGGSAAGPTAASTARRNDPTVNITLLEKGEFISYSA
jgi:hypothetical protein